MKKCLLLTILLFSASANLVRAVAPIQVDAHVAANGASTWNITTTHPNELIIISCGGYGGGGSVLPTTAGTVKVNGSNATYETRGTWRDISFTWQANIWAYAAPVAGTYTIVCTETNVISPYYFNFATSIYENACALALSNIFIGGNDSNHGPTTITASITTPMANCWVYGSVNDNDNGNTGLVAFNGQLTLLNKTYISDGIDGAQADSSYPAAGTYTITHTDIGASNVWLTFVLIGVKPTCALPVQLLSFSCDNSKNGQGIELNWSTATETNSKEFTIERSADGIQFSPIGTLAAAGNSDIQRNYVYTDESPATGINYYRLVETDKDGSSQTFNVSTCIVNKAINEIYPNPSRGTFTLSLGASSSTQSIVIYDLTGREIMSQQFEPNTNDATYNVNLPAGCKGIFMARIINGDQLVAVKKIIVY